LVCFSKPVLDGPVEGAERGLPSRPLDPLEVRRADHNLAAGTIDRQLEGGKARFGGKGGWSGVLETGSVDAGGQEKQGADLGKQGMMARGV
jgi:hypothetical protein